MEDLFFYLYLEGPDELGLCCEAVAHVLCYVLCQDIAVDLEEVEVGYGAIFEVATEARDVYLPRPV